MAQNNVNQEAWRLIDEASCVSSLVTENDRKRGEVNAENMYPTTKEETDRMDSLLNQAREAAEDPREERFAQRYAELTDVVSWSNSRHKTWSWALIAGALLGVLLLWWWTNSRDKDIDFNQHWVSTVEAWIPCDTTITYEQCSADVSAPYEVTMSSANKYKANKLAKIKSDIQTREKWIAETQETAVKDNTKENRETADSNADKYGKEIKQLHKEFDEVAKWSFDDAKNDALKWTNVGVDNAKGKANRILILLIIVIVLIPLYIWTGYNYGYDITASRKRQKFLTWVRKVGFALAGFFFGAGLVFKFFNDTYVDSNGRRYRDDSTGTQGTNLFFKGLLMLVGAIIFAFVSIIIMLVEVVAGLKNKLGAKGTVKEAKVIEN